MSVSLTISLVTSKFFVVKEAKCHDALSSRCLSLFVAVNNLEQRHATFNSVQVTQSTSNHHHTFLCFRIGNVISCLLLTEFSILFPKEKPASIFLMY